MYSISNGCSDGNHHGYDANSIGEIRLVCYQSTNTLPGTGKSDWLSQGHGACNAGAPRSYIMLLAATTGLHSPSLTYMATMI